MRKLETPKFLKPGYDCRESCSAAPQTVVQISPDSPLDSLCRGRQRKRGPYDGRLQSGEEERLRALNKKRLPTSFPLTLTVTLADHTNCRSHYRLLNSRQRLTVPYSLVPRSCSFVPGSYIYLASYRTRYAFCINRSTLLYTCLSLVPSVALLTQRIPLCLRFTLSQLRRLCLGHSTSVNRPRIYRLCRHRNDFSDSTF